jgi:hypothetical protein
MLEKHLLIDSRDRKPGSTIENAVFELDRPIHDFECVRVNYVMTYNSFFNVTANNNTWKLYTPDTNFTTTTTITPGFYSAQQLAISISQSAYVNVSFDTDTKLFTWTVQAGFSIETLASQNLFGFSGVKAGSFSSQPNLTNPQSIQFFSPDLQGTDCSYFTKRETIGMYPFLRLPIFSEYGSSNFYQPSFPILIRCETQTLQRFSIQLKDGEGNAPENSFEYEISLTFL